MGGAVGATLPTPADTDCGVCTARPVDVVLTACGHALLYMPCLERMLASPRPACPVCKLPLLAGAWAALPPGASRAAFQPGAVEAHAAEEAAAADEEAEDAAEAQCAAVAQVWLFSHGLRIAASVSDEETPSLFSFFTTQLEARLDLHGAGQAAADGRAAAERALAAALGGFVTRATAFAADAVRCVERLKTLVRLLWI